METKTVFLLLMILALVIFIIDISFPSSKIKTGTVKKVSKQIENVSIFNSNIDTLEVSIQYDNLYYDFYLEVEDCNSNTLVSIMCPYEIYSNPPKIVNYKEFTSKIFKFKHYQIL